MNYLKSILVTAVLFQAVTCQAASLAEKPAEWKPEESIILIRSVHQAFDYTTPWKQTSMTRTVGTGFIIAGKRILTNAHNVSDYKYIELKKENVAKYYPATVEFVAHDCDLAILKVFDESFFNGTVELQIGQIPKVNTTVSTHGFPMGGRRISVTKGVISRIEMDVYAHSGVLVNQGEIIIINPARNTMV